MNKLFVSLVRRLGAVWKSLGADPTAVALILDAKLKMNDRGGYVLGQRQAPQSGMEYLVFFVMFLFGGMTIGLYFLFDRPADATGLIFTAWIIYIGLLLVTELSNNLFDTRDLYILLTRPITDATFSLARTLHIATFTAKFALCLGSPVLVFVSIYYGPWAGISFLVAAICTVIITMVLTLGAYLLLIRYVPSHKVRRYVGYIQIFLTSFFFILYQLPNLLNTIDFGDKFVLPQLVGDWWGYVFPGLWVGGLWGGLNGLDLTGHTFVQAALGLVVTVGGSLFYVHQSKGYGQKLIDMERAGSASGKSSSDEADGKTSWFAPRRWIGDWLTQPGVERASFNFHWRMMQRDLDYKQRTVPSIVLFPILTLGLVGKSLFNGEETIDGAFLLNEGRWMALIIVYTLVLIIIAPITNTKSSKHFKASWIFQASPAGMTGPMQYGQFLATMGAFFLPIALLVYLSLLLYSGLALLPDLMLAFGVVVSVGLIIVGNDETPPFSLPVDNNNLHAFGTVILSFLLTSVLGVGQYFFGRLFPWLLPFAAVVFWAFLFFQIRSLRRRVS